MSKDVPNLESTEQSSFEIVEVMFDINQQLTRHDDKQMHDVTWSSHKA